MIEQFIQRLNDRITAGLPGMIAHRRMAPPARPLVSFDEHDYPAAKKGSVLILFYPFKETICMALIKRQSYDGVHSGQVAFPGGKIEKDETAEQAALRETKEEIGVDENKITIFNRLSNVYIPPSNFFVFPFLGYAKQRPDFHPDQHEVEYIIESPVDVLMDDSIKGIMDIQRGDQIMKAPYYEIMQHKVWGATAIILSELEFLLTELMI